MSRSLISYVKRSQWYYRNDPIMVIMTSQLWSFIQVCPVQGRLKRCKGLHFQTRWQYHLIPSLQQWQNVVELNNTISNLSPWPVFLLLLQRYTINGLAVETWSVKTPHYNSILVIALSPWHWGHCQSMSLLINEFFSCCQWPYWHVTNDPSINSSK